MNISAKAQFREDFFSTIEKRFKKARQECIDSNLASEYNNLLFKSIRSPQIAYIFLMDDSYLFDRIHECETAGYATKSEISGMFKVHTHVMDSRVEKSHDERLRIYWNKFIERITETYPLANPSSFNSEKKTEDGEIIQCGYVSAIKGFAARGFSKQEICESLEINPASWYEYPVLAQAYSQGEGEFKSVKSDNIINGVKQNFIRNNFFIEVVIPQIKIEAFEHTVILTERHYSIDKTGKRTLVREVDKPKVILGNKDMRDLAIKFSSGDLVNQITFGKEGGDKTKGIPMFPNSKQVTDKGTFDNNSIEDAEYEPIKQ